MSDSKSIMAEKAYGLIAPDDVVFLDISSLTLALAQKIARGSKSMTVVTNMPGIADVVSENPLVESILAPGDIDEAIGGVVGDEAVQYLSGHQFDLCFLGTCNVGDSTGTVSTSNEAEREIKRAVLAVTKRPILMAGGDKFGKPDDVVYGSVDDFSAVVADDLNAEQKAFLDGLGVGYI